MNWRVFHAWTVPVPAWLLRKLAASAWWSRLVPTEPGMVDLLGTGVGAKDRR